MENNIFGMFKIFNHIKEACNRKSDVSSTRVIAFYILGLIISFSIYFIGSSIYEMVIPNEMIIIFASLLAHQLTLLGINKHNETKQTISEIQSSQKDKKEETEER